MDTTGFEYCESFSLCTNPRDVLVDRPIVTLTRLYRPDHTPRSSNRSKKLHDFPQCLCNNRYRLPSLSNFLYSSPTRKWLVDMTCMGESTVAAVTPEYLTTGTHTVRQSAKCKLLATLTKYGVSTSYGIARQSPFGIGTPM